MADEKKKPEDVNVDAQERELSNAELDQASGGMPPCDEIPESDLELDVLKDAASTAIYG